MYEHYKQSANKKSGLNHRISNAYIKIVSKSTTQQLNFVDQDSVLGELESDKNYRIGSTSKTPAIYLDLVCEILEIKGRSVLQNSLEFYKPILNSLSDYATKYNSKIDVNLNFEYFNTNSSISILMLLKLLEEIQNRGVLVIINWYYDDASMLEVGQDYQSMINLPFKMIWDEIIV